MSDLLKQSDTDQRLPLYQQLRDELAKKIRDQTWRPGQLIPSETELKNTYQIAVGTVRKAIEALIAEGIVERIHGKGTFVRKPSFNNSLFRFFRFESADGRRSVPSSRILRRQIIEASADIASALDLNTGAPVIELLRLRLKDDKAVVAENIYLCAHRFQKLMLLDTNDFGDLLYPLYERQCDQIVASAKEVLTVTGATDAQAHLLGLKPHQSVVSIERLALGVDGTPLEWRHSSGDACHFRYNIEIR